MARFKRTLRFSRTCQHCGVSFMAFKADAKYCRKHESVERVYVSKKREKACIQCGNVFVGQGKVCGQECGVARHRELAIARRRAAGMMPRVKKVKRGKITSARVLPVAAVKEEVVLMRHATKCFVQVDRRTRVEFTSEERRDRWLKRQREAI